MKKVIYFSEDISFPFDEGIKKTAKNILSFLAHHADLKAIARKGSNINGCEIISIKTNKFLISNKIAKIIHDFEPDIIIYLPLSSGTFMSMIRMKILWSYYPKAVPIIILSQPKRLLFSSFILKLNRNVRILTPSTEVEHYFLIKGMRSEFLPLFTNISEFSKNEKSKLELRERYNIPINKFIITHVGHLNYGRNLEALLPLQKGNNQVVVILSSSTPTDVPKDIELKNRLISKGVIILDDFIENISEVYKLSDLYVFPVNYSGGSIGTPLSIFEALICNIPVLTTNYGSVTRLFNPQKDPVYIYSSKDFPFAVDQIKRNIPKFNGQKIVNEINKLFEKKLLDCITQ